MSGGLGEALERVGESLAALGCRCQRLDGHPDLPVPTLLVAAPGDDPARPVLFNLMFMPMEETGLGQVDLLQFYFPVLDGLGEDRRRDVALLLAELDAELPIGQLGLREGEVGLRHMMLLERGQVPSRGLLEEALAVLLKLRELLAGTLRAVAAGDMTVEQARAVLP